MNRKLGDIPLDDYLGWVGARSRWRRPLRVLALLMLCAACVAAGSCWPRHTRDLTLSDADQMLASSDVTPDQRRQAVVVITDKVRAILERLGQAARLEGSAGGDACRSLRHAAVNSLEQIRLLTADHVHSDIQQRSLDLIKKSIERIEDASKK